MKCLCVWPLTLPYDHIVCLLPAIQYKEEQIARLEEQEAKAEELGSLEAKYETEVEKLESQLADLQKILRMERTSQKSKLALFRGFIEARDKEIDKQNKTVAELEEAAKSLASPEKAKYMQVSRSHSSLPQLRLRCAPGMYPGLCLGWVPFVFIRLEFVTYVSSIPYILKQHIYLSTALLIAVHRIWRRTTKA